MRQREKKAREIPIEIHGQPGWREDVLAAIWSTILDEMERAESDAVGAGEAI